MAKETITLGINLRKNNNSHSRAYGKYYPEVDRTDTLSLRGFAEHLTNHGCLFGRDVIEAVLTKVVQCLPELCSQGVAVKLGDLGIFYPTAQVAKNGALEENALAGANPNDVVKAIHIRFLPNSSKLDNITGPQFKKKCTMVFRDVVESIDDPSKPGSKITAKRTLQEVIAGQNADAGGDDGD